MYHKSRKVEVELLLHQGYSYTEVAKILGISKQRVHQIAKTNDLDKVWKEKEKSGLYQRKANFSLGPEMYGICSLKFSRKKQNSLRENIEFSISFDELDWPLYCPILNIPIEYENIQDGRVEGSPSFDRIDSTKGYISGNVRIISWRANRIKNDGTAQEHRKIAEYIDSYALKTIA